MADQLLQTVGEALANISGSIAECIRTDAQNAHSPGHVEHFQQCLGDECRRLRNVGEDGLAGALEALAPSLSRLMTKG